MRKPGGYGPAAPLNSVVHGPRRRKNQQLSGLQVGGLMHAGALSECAGILTVISEV